MADTSQSTSDRDSPTPSRSDSPSHGSRLSSKSYESIKSHPLLGDTSDEAIPAADVSIDTSLTGSITSAQQPAPYVVPYKTRQRPTSTTQLSQSSLGVFSQPSQAAAATTTSASATSPLPTSPSNPSSLTNKLQSQNLQASAQAAGLNSDSAGWYILQKLIAATEKENEKEKALVTALKALRTGKGCLLLPREHVSFSDVNSAFLRDHILLKDGRNVTTLGGVRGVMVDDAITFTSCVPGIDMKKPPSSEAAFTELLNPGTPAVVEGVFPSCPIGKSVDVHISRHNPLPVKQEKPAARPRSLVNIFGGQRSVSSGSSVTLAKQQEEATASAAGASARAPSMSDSQSSMPIQAWTIESPLSSKILAKAIQNAIANRLQTGADLGDSQLNDMVLNFVRRFHPSSKTPTQPTPPALDPNSNLDEVDLANADIVAVTAAMQEFYHDARQRLEAVNRERIALSEALSEDDEKSANSQADLIDVDVTLEKVEAFLCETLYDKLFAPASSSDRQDDESLSMRIAGLHMLDLTLDHLGIQTDLVTGDPEADDVQRTVRDGLEEIISLCGKEFQKLQYSDCRTPLAKLNVLVSVHKIIADTLEVLPPITMKDEGERRNSSVPQAVAGQVIEMSADTKSLGSRSAPKFSRTSSEASEASDAEKTPRLAASRPPSTASANPPAIKLHDTSFTEPYQLSTPSEFIAEEARPFTGAELETTDTSTRSVSPRPKPRTQNTTSADAILPLLIYAVVQANPVRLVSHVMFVQRFRADSLMAGEGEYCLCNMEAVRTFLMSCDVASLGLGAGKLITASDLPAPSARIRQRAGQHIDNMVGTAVGSAGRVLGTAADIGIGGYKILGGLLTRTPSNMETSQQPQTLEDVQSVLAGGSTKPANSIRQAILRRGTNASLVSARTLDSKISKETEMSDVKAIGSSPQQDNSQFIQQGSSTASISSRLASLPGLTKLGSPAAGQATSATAGNKTNTANSAGPAGIMSGFMSSMPSMPSMPRRSFAGSTTDNAAALNGDSEPPGSLSIPAVKDSQSRRSTISIFSTPYSPTSAGEVSTPLLSPTPSNLSMQRPASPPFTENEALAPTDRTRSASFMSHSQHYEVLKANIRPRSDSAASNSSGSALGLPPSRTGVAGAFGAVTNLVSNVRQRHAYSTSVSSQTSISKNVQSATAPPIQRFLECEADDLKMSEVAVLLADYKRLAAQLAEAT